MGAIRQIYHLSRPSDVASIDSALRRGPMLCIDLINVVKFVEVYRDFRTHMARNHRFKGEISVEVDEYVILTDRLLGNTLKFIDDS